MKSVLVIALLQLAFVPLLTNAAKVRGVAPERLSLYDESKAFTCLDGSNTIPFNQVNDDYCDCRDGSDEPGTAACLNGSFACENLGYIVQMIPASRVNDGICDCCDGSDEYSSNAKCENKCLALAAKMREEEERLKQLRDQGSLKRQELINQGTEMRKTIQEKIQELEAKKVAAEAERQILEEKMKAAEALAKEAKDKQDKIFEEIAKEKQKKETEEKAKALFALLDLDKDSFLKPEELLLHQELDVLFDNDNHFTLEEAVKLLDQNEKIDSVVFASVYYEKISPHIKTESTEPAPPVEQAQPEEPPTEDLGHDDQHELDDDGENENPDQDPDHDDGDHEIPDQARFTPPPIPTQPPANENKYDAETQALIDESNKARQLYDEANKNVMTLSTEITDSNKKLNHDVGANNEFASMVDTCFEYEDREYVYKLCPFDKTVQRSKSNHGETVIGYWSSWGMEGADKYLNMKFNNGLACWNGPQRSTNVIITCGIENKLTAVSEPNRCEYEMRFETPAVCSDLNGGDQGAQQQHHGHDDL